MNNIIAIQNSNCRVVSINFEDIEFPTNILSFIDCGSCILVLLNFNQELFAGNCFVTTNYSSNIWCIDSNTNAIKWTSQSLHKTNEYFIHMDYINKRVFASTNQKNLYELNLDNGKIIE